MDHQSPRWSFLTRHAQVLLAIARTPTARLEEIAAACRVTERTAQRIVADLERADCLRRERAGRRIRYTVNPDAPSRHPVEAGLLVRHLIAVADRCEDEVDDAATQ